MPPSSRSRVHPSRRALTASPSSPPCGAGGEEVVRLVAKRLGFLYADEEGIARAAEHSGIDPEAFADEERLKSLYENLLQAMAYGGSVTGAPPVAGDDHSSESVR